MIFGKKMVEFLSAHRKVLKITLCAPTLPFIWGKKTMTTQILDYLQTQALSLNLDDVAVARAATQAVLANAQAHIDDEVVLHDRLPENLTHQLTELKQLFMALDSVYSRHAVQTAVIYALPENGDLRRVAQMGAPIETHLPMNENAAWQYLAVRAAQSGWANIAEDVANWLQIGELRGEHNQRAACQISLPICGEDGVVYGVLHLEHGCRLPENALADWVGLALGVLPTLVAWFPRETIDDEQ